LVEAGAHKIFPVKPLPAFAEQVRAQLKEHNQPELIRELRHEAIARTEEFDILCEVSIDPSKRPEQDFAPCPMCQPNKFIRGRLCYFPRLNCCAIIGHCCADKKQRDSAEHRFREASNRNWQEDFLLEALPLIPRKLEVIAATRGKAVEALRLHKKFRKDAHRLMQLLREISKNHGGRLQVQFEVESKAAVNERVTSGRFERLVDMNDYGVLSGLTALRANYDPVLELNDIESVLRVIEVGVESEFVMNYIIAMDVKHREWTYTVLNDIDSRRWRNFTLKLDDFCSFFDSENLVRLARWGEDSKNRNQVYVVDRMLNMGVRQVELYGAGSRTALSPGPQLSIPIPAWPELPKRRSGVRAG